ncbi:LPS-assembly protein LptD [bacterium]|nr:LPS-assembly protein LptD [bacterium]
MHSWSKIVGFLLLAGTVVLGGSDKAWADISESDGGSAGGAAQVMQADASSTQRASHIAADKVIAEGDRLIAEGNVAVVIEQARLMCDSLTLDRVSGGIVATGDCLIYWDSDYVAADWLTYDPQTRTITMHNASGHARSLGQGSTASGLMFWADTMSWTQEKTELWNIVFTTCDKPTDELHFSLKSEHMTVYPDARVFADMAEIYVRKWHALTLPSLNVDLNADKRLERSFIPRIGDSSVDGFYIRTALPYTINKDNYGAVLLGYNTNTSFGVGLEHCYRFSNKGQGVAYYYRQGGKSTNQRYELSNNVYYNFDDENTLAWYFKANRAEIADEDLYRNITSNLSFKHTGERDTLYIAHNYRSNSKNTYNHNLRLYYNLKLTPDLAALVNADLSNTVTSASEGTKFHYAAGLRHTGELFDTDLMLENTSGKSMYHLNRNPELSLRSHPIFLGSIPVMATASFANVAEYPSDVHTTRTELTLQVPNQVFDYGSGKLTGGAGVRQIFYGTGHSMYALAAQAGWMQNLGNFSTVRLDYNWMQPCGETPLQHDLYSGYSNITGGLEFFHNDVFNLAVIGGYNLRSERFQNITPRLMIKPARRWKCIIGSNYDPNNSQWRSLDSNLTLQLADNFTVSHWSVYDLINNRFTYHDYQLNYEGHDWITSIAYRSVQKEVYLQFSLKAFALPSSDIGPDATKPILPCTLPNAFNMNKK